MANTPMVETWVESVNGAAGVCSPFFDDQGVLHFVSERTGDVFSVDKNREVISECNSGGVPRGACYYDGKLYLADQGHAAVMVWMEGKPSVVVRMYEEKAFKGPSSIIFDSGGALYFTDSGPFGQTGLHNPTGSLFCVTNGGQRNSKILKPLALACLAHPTGLALSPDERFIYVTEMMTNRLLRFFQKPSGVYHASVFHQFSGGIGPSAVTVAKDGTIYVAHYESFASGGNNTGKVTVLAPDGSTSKEILLEGASEVSGITLGPDQTDLYLTESSTNSVYRVVI